MKKCYVCKKQLCKQKTYCSRICMGLAYKTRKHSEESLQKMRGRKLSPETISKQNAAKTREKIRIDGEFYCRVCDKKFTSNTSLRSHMSYCSIADLLTSEKCFVCDVSFKSRRSLLIHKSLKHAPKEIAAERRRKMKDAKKNCDFRKTSHAEEDFFKEILVIHPDAIRNFMIPDYSHVYDIFIPSTNTIIEFDGDFWHGNKAHYALSDRMKKQFRLDEANNAKAISSGHKIVRVWQSESHAYLESLKGIKNDSSKNF